MTELVPAQSLHVATFPLVSAVKSISEWRLQPIQDSTHDLWESSLTLQALSCAAQQQWNISILTIIIIIITIISYQKINNICFSFS